MSEPIVEKTVYCKECGNKLFFVFVAANYISIKCTRCSGVKTIVDTGEGDLVIQHDPK